MKKLILITLVLISSLMLPMFALAKPELMGTNTLSSQTKLTPPVLLNLQKWPNYKFRISAKGAKESTDRYNFYYADWNGSAQQNDPNWLKEHAHKSSNIAPDMTGSTIIKMLNPSETGTNAVVYLITITDKNGNESNPISGRVDLTN